MCAPRPLWRCAVSVCHREGFVPWGTPRIPAPTAAPEVSLTPTACAGCSAGKNKPRCTASRANVHSLSGVLHPIYAFPYRAACSKHPQGPRPILPARSSASCRIYPSPPSLSHGDAASALSPALQKATPQRGHAVFIRNKTQRAGLLWQVCSKYQLEHGGHLGSSDYTLLPRETLPSPGQALPQPHQRCQETGAALTQIHPGVALQATSVMEQVP